MKLLIAPFIFILTRCIHTFGYRLEESELEFVNAAKECCGVQPTDKVIDHEYQLMYGMFLLPMIKRHIERNALTSSANEGVANSRKFKMLEIGLGCDMKYGPGKSVKLWKHLLNGHGDIWMAETRAHCIQKMMKEGRVNGYKVLIGDQSNTVTLAQWKNETMGEFDVIIDDGGHRNNQILTSFYGLFDALLPGGLYFMEDLHVGTHKEYGYVDGTDSMSEVIMGWIDTLLIKSYTPSRLAEGPRSRHPKPEAVDWIFCQAEACVISKKKTAVTTSSAPL